MSGCGVIRGAWGPISTFHSTNGEPLMPFIQAVRDRGDQADRVYVFGKENDKILRDMGFATTLLEEDRKYEKGHCGWNRKYQIYRAAIEDFPDGFLWLDFDVEQVRPIPDGFWETLVAGQPFRSPLAFVLRINSCGCPWRTIPTEIRELPLHWNLKEPVTWLSVGYRSAQLVPLGTWIWISSQEVIDTLEAISKIHPTWSDQRVMAAMVDRHYYGWPGAREYNRMGHGAVGFWSNTLLDVIPQEEAVWRIVFKHKRWFERNRHLYADA